jgi:hypothetical protein
MPQLTGGRTFSTLHCLVSALFLIAQVTTVLAQGTINPSEELARQLWSDSEGRLSAILYIEWKQPGALHDHGVGTGFMISDTYALTAGHVVCDLETRQPYQIRNIQVGGRGGTIAQVDKIECFGNGTDAVDYAILTIAPLANGRRHFNPGSDQFLSRDPFVTTFGFGRNPNGGHVTGDAQTPRDPQNRYRTNMDAVEGDSGSPVLDCAGNSVGILVAGNYAGTTAFIPISAISDKLTTLGITLAHSQACGALRPKDALVEQFGKILNELHQLEMIKGEVLFPQIDDYLRNPTVGNWLAVKITAKSLIEDIRKAVSDSIAFDAQFYQQGQNVIVLIAHGVPQIIDQSYNQPFRNSRQVWNGFTYVTQPFVETEDRPTEAQVRDWSERLRQLYQQLNAEISKLLLLIQEKS